MLKVARKKLTNCLGSDVSFGEQGHTNMMKICCNEENRKGKDVHRND